jgi:hypothetical protein
MSRSGSDCIELQVKILYKIFPCELMVQTILLKPDPQYEKSKVTDP